jgi:ribosomal protein L2
VTDIIHDPGRGAPLAKVRARAAVRRTSVTLKNYPQLCCVLREDDDALRSSHAPPPVPFA